MSRPSFLSGQHCLGSMLENGCPSSFETDFTADRRPYLEGTLCLSGPQFPIFYKEECRSSSELQMKAAALAVSFTGVLTAQGDRQNPAAALT